MERYHCGVDEMMAVWEVEGLERDSEVESTGSGGYLAQR